MLQQLDGKPNVVFQHGSAPLHFYMMWQHSWKGSCLRYGLVKGWLTSWSLKSPDWNTATFSQGLYKRWYLHSASTYNPKQFTAMNMNSDCKNWSVFIEKKLHMKSITVLVHAGQ